MGSVAGFDGEGSIALVLDPASESFGITVGEPHLAKERVLVAEFVGFDCLGDRHLCCPIGDFVTEPRQDVFELFHYTATYGFGLVRQDNQVVIYS